MLRPTRIQAYRGYDELEGRDVMREAELVQEQVAWMNAWAALATVS
jgi:hypothetical protein